MAPTRSGASSKGDDEIAEYFRGGGSDDDHIRDAGDMGDRDTRPRWAGTPDELARVLVAMADTSGKSFIRYDESKDTKAARLNKDRITAAGHHLRKLREVHAGLNFKKSTITAALRIVVKKMESKWCLSDLHQRVLAQRARLGCAYFRWLRRRRTERDGQSCIGVPTAID